MGELDTRIDRSTVGVTGVAGGIDTIFQRQEAWGKRSHLHLCAG